MVILINLTCLKDDHDTKGSWRKILQYNGGMSSQSGGIFLVDFVIDETFSRGAYNIIDSK